MTNPTSDIVHVVNGVAYDGDGRIAVDQSRAAIKLWMQQEDAAYGRRSKAKRNLAIVSK